MSAEDRLCYNNLLIQFEKFKSLCLMPNELRIYTDSEKRMDLLYDQMYNHTLPLKVSTMVLNTCKGKLLN